MCWDRLPPLTAQDQAFECTRGTPLPLSLLTMGTEKGTALRAHLQNSGSTNEALEVWPSAGTREQEKNTEGSNCVGAI